MHFHLRHSRVDSKGRVHISADEMAEVYKNFHAALNDTYWETASNHKICTDAMEMLKTTHISKKNGRFLMLFTSVLSEAYSHANYNVQDLLYDDRDTVRANYWTDVLLLYKAVMTKADKVNAQSKCYHQLALLLHFASLYSLYKDVADEEFIVSLYKRAENYVFNDHHRMTEAETEQIREYYDAIQTIYHLRGERRRASVQAPAKVPVPEEAPTLVLDDTDVVDAAPVTTSSSQKSPLTKDELYAMYDKALDRHKKMIKQNQIEEEQKPAESEHKSKKTMLHSSSCAAMVQPVVEETELEEVIKHLNPVPSPEKVKSVAEEVEKPQNQENVVHLRQNVVNTKYCPERRNTLAAMPTLREVAGKDIIVLDKFDFIGEFERRCGRRKAAPGARMNLPVIGKPHKADAVQSYRRKGLFDDVDYRQPPSLHQVHPFEKQNSEGSSRPHSLYTCEEEDAIKEVDEEDTQNNNSLSNTSYITEKIIRAVFAEKPVSPNTHLRRMSAIH
ncbi:hypothetical protein OESDEN_06824 [Oesophagostomum dentatum]|uniref:Uncharacterized protein n=1 Tax=Oesophagostomum dentatum TaxID=61180 RepID=A0A0B1T7P6_OESDE|nr:hypothetical protein OESDEN_06824 [Oesophagostomum dentatum]